MRIEDRLAGLGRRRELLRVPALAYGAVTLARNALYDWRVLRSRRLGVPVVSVGNLSAGGTGKTPAVMFLARELQRRGRRVGILSRGYGARTEGAGGNDESELLAQLLPGVEHVQGADRVRTGRELVRRGVDAILLDDGFQHRALARDLELVLVDATRPWGLPPELGAEPTLLPHGLLRERPDRLGRAHALCLTRTDQVGEQELERLEAELQRFAPGVPILRAVHRPAGLRRLDGKARPLGELAGREVDLVSGLGNPEAFARTALALGVRIASERRLPDHHAFEPADLEGLGRRPILCTAKDAVKLRSLPPAGREGPDLSDAWVLEVEWELTSGAQVLEALLDALFDATPSAPRLARPPRRHG